MSMVLGRELIIECGAPPECVPAPSGKQKKNIGCQNIGCRRGHPEFPAAARKSSCSQRLVSAVTRSMRRRPGRNRPPERPISSASHHHGSIGSRPTQRDARVRRSAPCQRRGTDQIQRCIERAMPRMAPILRRLRDQTNARSQNPGGPALQSFPRLAAWGWRVRVDLCRRLHDHLRHRHVTLAAVDSAHGDWSSAGSPPPSLLSSAVG